MKCNHLPDSPDTELISLLSIFKVTLPLIKFNPLPLEPGEVFQVTQGQKKFLLNAKNTSYKVLQILRHAWLYKRHCVAPLSVNTQHEPPLPAVLRISFFRAQRVTDSKLRIFLFQLAFKPSSTVYCSSGISTPAPAASGRSLSVLRSQYGAALRWEDRSDTWRQRAVHYRATRSSVRYPDWFRNKAIYQ